MLATLQHLFGLLVVILVALGGAALILRRQPATHNELQRGYPSDIFPRPELTGVGPLAELEAVQSRLLTLYRHLPPRSDAAIWLRTFLRELREIMDSAYRVALVGAIYGHAAPLTPLISEILRAEQEIVAHIERRLLFHEADAQAEMLEGRLAALRMCARELATWDSG